MTETTSWEEDQGHRRQLAERGLMEVEFYIVADPDGDYMVRNDEDEALEAYVEDYGGETHRQTTKVVLLMPMPKARAVSAEIQENDGNPKLTISQG